MPLRDLPPFDRPRERLVRAGPHDLTDGDLLAVILGSGTRALDAPAVARGLVARWPDLRRLAAAGVGEIAGVPGMGLAQACRVKAALALAGRLAERPFDRGDPVRDAGQIYERVGRRLAVLEEEVFVALALDGQGRILSELVVARGGACSVDFRPSDVFRALLREGATSTVLVHNHPSGDPEPSAPDYQTTARLREAGELLGLILLDHVVVARGGYRSCLERAE